MSSQAAESFRDLLVRFRGRSRLTQRELAAHMGVHRRSVQEWEIGVTYPSAERLEALVRVLLHSGGLTAGREEAEAYALWTAVQRDAPHTHAPFDQSWFARLLGDRSGAPSPLTKPTRTRSTSVETRAERRQDWGDAPDLADFRGRVEELATLRNLLVEDRCRLLVLLGLGGMGKTSLAARVAYDVAPSFDRVYWRSLRDAPSPSDWLSGAIGFLSDQQVVPPTAEAERMGVFVRLLRERRCLIVLDNVETLFDSGRSDPRYREGLGGYGRVIEVVGEGTHESCLLMTSREAPPELARLVGGAVHVFRVGGLHVADAQALLANKRLSGTEEQWQQLNARFGGNGLALKIVGETIRELFGGELADFLNEWDASSMFGDTRRLLAGQVERCAVPERQVLRALAIQRDPVNLRDLLSFTMERLERGAVLEAIEALRHRSLVDRAPAPGVAAFTLQSMVLEYVTDQLVRDLAGEITRGQPALLAEQPVIQAHATDYLRLAQERLFGQAILRQIEADAGSAEVPRLLLALLEGWRGQARGAQGFGPGNVVNLLRLLRRELRGVDLSRLAIRQAYLADVEAQDASLSGSWLGETVLAESFNFPTCVSLSSDSALMAAGTSAGEVFVWRVADRTPLLVVVHGRTGGVRGIAISNDGRSFVSGGTDAAVRLWDIATGRQLMTFQGHTRAVRGLALSANGELLATASEDGTVRLWNVITGEQLARLDCDGTTLTCVALSADGRVLASGGADRVVRVWEVERGDGRLLFTSQDHLSEIYCVGLSDDGRVLASSGEDGTVRVHKTDVVGRSMALDAHEGGAFGVSLKGEGRLLASGGGDGAVRVWDTSTGQPVASMLGHSGIVYSVALSVDGYLLSGGGEGTVRLWQAATAGVERAADTTAAAALGEWRPVATLEGHTGAVWCASMSPDGRLLASGHADGVVRLWDCATGAQVATFSGHHGGVWGVASAADGSLLASGAGDGSVKLWDLRSGEEIASVVGHSGGVRAVALSADGRLLASSGGEGTVQLWNTGRNAVRPRVTLAGHAGIVWGVAVSADGRVVASGGGETEVRVWDSSNGERLATLKGHTGGVRGVALSADGHLLASAGGDGAVRLWDTRNAQLLATLAGHNGGVRGVALSADGLLLASGGGDAVVHLWETNTARLIATMNAHTGGVRGIALSADGQVLASGSLDQTVRIWDTPTATCRHILRTERRYERMDITGLTGITDAQLQTLIVLGARAGNSLQPESQLY